MSSESENLDLSAVDADEVGRIRERLGIIAGRIAAAGGAVGPGGVQVVAVTKSRPAHVAAAAQAAGLTLLGESFAAELAAKACAFEHASISADWHYIGQLQTNKVRVVAPYVALYQSVDRASLVNELAKRVPGASILIQINLAEIPGRGGCAASAAPALIELARSLGLNPLGCMGVASPDLRSAAQEFSRLRSIVDREGLEICSMGMSQDLEIAVSEGSNMVRIGSDLVGTRS
jgi:uncharacterized pyridoxal phosphate-containing UPF0001 family protein